MIKSGILANDYNTKLLKLYIYQLIENTITNFLGLSAYDPFSFLILTKYHDVRILYF